MLLHCHSRKCNTTRDHKLKLDSYDAICMDCGEINNMVSDFMKNAMKSSGDIYRTATGRKAFMYKCPKCSIDRGVKIVDEQALCETCSHPLNLSSPMIEAIKQTAGAQSKSASQSAAVKQAQAAQAPQPKVATPSFPVDVEDDADEDKTPKAEINKGVIKRRSE